jgi:hypothetical protein
MSAIVGQSRFRGTYRIYIEREVMALCLPAQIALAETFSC